MKPSSAVVLRQIARLEPCTKLCVKQHSGLAMGTVLAAVTSLCEEGWVRCSERPSPQGGKPHARLTLGSRRVWAVDGGKAPRILSVSPKGEWQMETELPPNVTGICVQNAYRDLPKLSIAQALCYARNLAQPTAVVDQALLAYSPTQTVDLATMPSPMIGKTRLCFADAFALANPLQKQKLQEELSRWLALFWDVERTVFVQEDSLSPQDLASAALYWALYANQTA